MDSGSESNTEGSLSLVGGKWISVLWGYSIASDVYFTYLGLVVISSVYSFSSSGISELL